MLIMLSHMNKGPRQLDQPLVESRSPCLPPSFEPKGLENIMGLIIILTVEMMKIGGVSNIPPPRVDPLP
jgi:hypothetical protein